MMVMMVVARVAGRRYEAIPFRARLALRFQLHGDVVDAVLFEFVPHAALYFIRAFVAYDVQGGIMALPVHCPNMDMVRVKDSVELKDMRLDFLR